MRVCICSRLPSSLPKPQNTEALATEHWCSASASELQYSLQLVSFLNLEQKEKRRVEGVEGGGGGRKLLDLIDNFSNISAFKIDI